MSERAAPGRIPAFTAVPSRDHETNSKTNPESPRTPVGSLLVRHKAGRSADDRGDETRVVHGIPPEQAARLPTKPVKPLEPASLDPGRCLLEQACVYIERGTHTDEHG